MEEYCIQESFECVPVKVSWRESVAHGISSFKKKKERERDIIKNSTRKKMAKASQNCVRPETITVGIWRA